MSFKDVVETIQIAVILNDYPAVVLMNGIYLDRRALGLLNRDFCEPSTVECRTKTKRDENAGRIYNRANRENQ